MTYYVHEYNQENEVNDQFTRDIFAQCVQKVNCDYFYVDAFHIDKIFDYQLEHTTVLLGVRDAFTINKKHNIYYDLSLYNGMLYVESRIYEFAKQNPARKFIVFTEYYEPEKLKVNQLENVEMVHWSFLTDDKIEYEKVSIVKKNAQSNKTTIVLNRRMGSMHRIMLISYLYGKKLLDNVHASALQIRPKCTQTLMDVVDWTFDERHNEFRDVCIAGFEQACADVDKIAPDFEPYQRIPGSEAIQYWCNAHNLDQHLRPLYENSFVEIITETLFEPNAGIQSEKYLNSVYGQNFPIMLGPPGTVQFLRNLGFDMFDDIVDHSYDNVENYVDRLQLAIDSNLELITNSDYARERWNSCQDRFIKNFQFAKTDMYTIYKEQITARFDELI